MCYCTVRPFPHKHNRSVVRCCCEGCVIARGRGHCPPHPATSPPRPRRQRSSSPLTLARFLGLLFLVGLVFHYPWLLLVVAAVLGLWAVKWWERRLEQLRRDRRKRELEARDCKREPTVQVLTAGMLVVSTHPAAVLSPRMVGHIAEPTVAELLARDFELGTNLVLVDWHGARRQWESLDHLHRWIGQ